MTYTYNAHKGGGQLGDGPMTVEDLMRHLMFLPKHALVVMSVDGQSDHISPVVSLNTTYYEDAEAKGAMRFEDEPVCQGWLNNAPDPGTALAVCLWPQVKEGSAR